MPVTEWMGFRPSTPDSLPVIGPSPRNPDVFYAFGHGHLGLTMAARTAELVRDGMTDRRSKPQLAPYLIDRLAECRFVPEAGSQASSLHGFAPAAGSRKRISQGAAGGGRLPSSTFRKKCASGSAPASRSARPSARSSPSKDRGCPRSAGGHRPTRGRCCRNEHAVAQVPRADRTDEHAVEHVAENRDERQGDDVGQELDSCGAHVPPDWSEVR
jgi:hypothetical protein